MIDPRISELQQAVRVLSRRVLGEDLALSDIAGLATPEPPARLAYDDSALKADVVRLRSEADTLRMKVDQLIALTKQHESDLQHVVAMLRDHTHETIRTAAA